jgi:hypothetical protein
MGAWSQQARQAAVLLDKLPALPKSIDKYDKLQCCKPCLKYRQVRQAAVLQVLIREYSK